MTQIEARSARAEYAKLSTELQAMFCECRLELVGDIVEQRIHQLSSLPVQALTRNGCAYLMQARAPHSPETTLACNAIHHCGGTDP